jgi:hypothetical protein
LGEFQKPKLKKEQVQGGPMQPSWHLLWVGNTPSPPTKAKSKAYLKVCPPKIPPRDKKKVLETHVKPIIPPHQSLNINKQIPFFPFSLRELHPFGYFRYLPRMLHYGSYDLNISKVKNFLFFLVFG